MRHTIDPRQGRLFDPFDGIIPPLGRQRLLDGWQGVFRAVMLELMPAKELGKHFHPTIGRPTKELYSVAGLIFLQEFRCWTNAEAVEAYLFHTDVEFALNLEPGIDEMCDRTFERYRKIFLEDALAGEVMDRVTARLVDLLDLDISKQRLDSTHVFSDMATFGRTHMMAVVIKRFLTQLKRHERAAYEALPAELRQRYAPSQAQLLAKGSKDADNRGKTRQQVAEDLHDLINRFADHPGMRDRTSYQALVKIFEQQCELVGARVKVRAKTGGNCIQNPSDPEATYSGAKGPGYQVQLSETCSPDNDVQLLTTVLPQTAAEPDSYALLPMLKDLQKKDCLPEEMLVDTAYGSDDNVQEAAAMGVEVISPVAGPKGVAGVEDAAAPLNRDDFAVDERNGTVEACPAGHAPAEAHYDADKKTTTIHMPAEACQNCPFRGQCPIDESKPGTFTLKYTDQERRLDARRHEQQTSVFWEHYAPRSGIESTNSGLKRRLGLGKLRVRGQRAVFHALYLKTAGWNLLRAAASGRLRGLVAAWLARFGAARCLCLPGRLINGWIHWKKAPEESNPALSYAA
jgi:Transposase DDE domain